MELHALLLVVELEDGLDLRRREVLDVPEQHHRGRLRVQSRQGLLDRRDSLSLIGTRSKDAAGDAPPS